MLVEPSNRCSRLKGVGPSRTGSGMDQVKHGSRKQTVGARNEKKKKSQWVFGQFFRSKLNTWQIPARHQCAPTQAGADIHLFFVRGQRNETFRGRGRSAGHALFPSTPMWTLSSSTGGKQTREITVGAGLGLGRAVLRSSHVRLLGR
jgi:hypothetical protein